MYNKNKYIRIKDLSKKLNVRPSSVTNVIKKLKELNYVDYEKYGIITLKEDGMKMGYFLLKRHNTIETFFKNLGIKTNLDEIEILEHDININTLKEIYLFNKFLYKNKDIKEKYLIFKKSHYKNIDLYINKNP
jgi:Mn-dependent DtxR family transcriptional regulator